MTKDLDLFLLKRFRAATWQSKDITGIKSIVMIQGGGARGSWQSGILSRLAYGRTIKPIALFGTSIGAINAFIFGAAFNPATSGRPRLFRNFWRNLERRRSTYICNIKNALHIRETFSEWISGTSMKGLLDFEMLRAIFAELLEGLKTSIYVYAYAADVHSRLPHYGQVLYPTFWIKPDEELAEVHHNSFRHGHCDIISALTSSACLPPVRGFLHDKMNLKDGGLVTNLPADTIVTQGAYGGDFAIIMLSKRLRDFCPKKDPIDFKTLHMLRQLKTIQTQELERSNKSVGNSYYAITHSPVVLLEPENKLASGLWLGFVFKSLVRKDYVAGLRYGNKFKESLSDLMSDKFESVRPYLLINTELPEIPLEVPGYTEWWAIFLQQEKATEGSSDD